MSLELDLPPSITKKVAKRGKVSVGSALEGLKEKTSQLISTKPIKVSKPEDSIGTKKRKVSKRVKRNRIIALLLLAGLIFGGFKLLSIGKISVPSLVGMNQSEANARRFARSAARLALPEMPEELFLETIHALVKQDAGWTPGKVGEALYIRPFMIATEVGLGVRPTNKATYLLIATPAGAYFDPSKAVSVWISTEYVRAALGGTGEAKCGGNYAASLVAQKAAAKEGCDQVVWIDAVERKWIEEMGGMNLYFVKGKGSDATVVTPKLTGTLLPGITRDSILSVAKDLGYETEEVMLSVDDWRQGVTSGEISEIFACGTAAVVSPVGQAKSALGTWVTGDGQPGPITMQIRNHLLAIQHGTTEDKHGWVKKVAL